MYPTVVIVLVKTQCLIADVISYKCHWHGMRRALNPIVAGKNMVHSNVGTLPKNEMSLLRYNNQDTATILPLHKSPPAPQNVSLPSQIFYSICNQKNLHFHRPMSDRMKHLHQHFITPKPTNITSCHQNLILQPSKCHYPYDWTIITKPLPTFVNMSFSCN